MPHRAIAPIVAATTVLAIPFTASAAQPPDHFEHVVSYSVSGEVAEIVAVTPN